MTVSGSQNFQKMKSKVAMMARE